MEKKRKRIKRGGGGWGGGGGGEGAGGGVEVLTPKKIAHVLYGLFEEHSFSPFICLDLVSERSS